jgi:hypothetical protein
MERAQHFDDMLNELYEPYEIAGVTLYPADILANSDPIAYRIAMADYIDAIESEEANG